MFLVKATLSNCPWSLAESFTFALLILQTHRSEANQSQNRNRHSLEPVEHSAVETLYQLEAAREAGRIQSKSNPFRLAIRHSSAKHSSLLFDSRFSVIQTSSFLFILHPTKIHCRRCWCFDTRRSIKDARGNSWRLFFVCRR